MLQCSCGTVTISANLIHVSKKRNQYKCILASLLVVVLFCLNSRGHIHTAQDDRLSPPVTCPTPPLIGWLCWSHYLCLTQTDNSQKFWSFLFSAVFELE